MKFRLVTPLVLMNTVEIPQVNLIRIRCTPLVMLCTVCTRQLCDICNNSAWTQLTIRLRTPQVRHFSAKSILWKCQLLPASVKTFVPSCQPCITIIHASYSQSSESSSSVYCTTARTTTTWLCYYGKFQLMPDSAYAANSSHSSCNVAGLVTTRHKAFVSWTFSNCVHSQRAPEILKEWHLCIISALGIKEYVTAKSWRESWKLIPIYLSYKTISESHLFIS